MFIAPAADGESMATSLLVLCLSTHDRLVWAVFCTYKHMLENFEVDLRRHFYSTLLCYLYAVSHCKQTTDEPGKLKRKRHVQKEYKL